MSRKIARITQDKKLLLANEVVEDNTKIRLDSDGRLDIDEIIEYPAELEGGRNLLRNASALNGDPFVRYGVDYNLVNSPTYINGTRTAHIVNDKGLNDGSMMNKGICIDIANLIPGEVYTFSFYGNDNWEKFHLISYYSLDASINNSQSVVINSNWTRYSVEFTPRSSNIDFYIRPNGNWEYDFDVYLNAPKIEKGSQATPWTPAPEDLGLNYPDSIQNFNSSISGNNIIAPEFIEGYPFVKPVIDDSLVLWLDGTTGNNYEQTGTWKDLSGKGNDGELVNFGYTEGSGWVDGGIDFDGVDDYVRVPNVLNMDGDFTVEIWAESDVYNTARALFNTNARVSSPWSDKGFYITNIYNPLYLYCYINDGINRYVGLVINNVSTFNNSHIVVKREGNMMYSFFNYTIQNSLDISSYESFKTDNDITIARGYKGKVKVVRIYDRPLTNEEILQNYQAGQCSPLLAMRGDV